MTRKFGRPEDFCLRKIINPKRLVNEYNSYYIQSTERIFKIIKQ